jgi:poly(A) polymerase/tRNA nucleotidyltransferase (CCA-adding enzyme)
MKQSSIPKPVLQIGHILESAAFKAYIVGGCVRDLLLGREPKDWDVATDATPKEIQDLFPDSVYENDFGTVLIKIRKSDEDLAPRTSHLEPRIVEVTTFRIEGNYTDKRHPDEVRFAKTIEEDLSRRDFTVNAMAMEIGASTEGSSFEKKAKSSRISHLAPPALLIDPYGGEADLKRRLIRAVGDPNERFSEDALRMARAVRFAVELGFTVEDATRRAVIAHSNQLEFIAKERVRDELIKIIMSERAGEGIYMLEELGLLKFILPELREGVGVGQNKHHVYSVFEHNVRALEYAASQNYSLEIRLASLLHDVGKPRSKVGDGPNSTFYQHEYIGARLTAKAIDRLHFPKEIIEKVAHLVRSHMFYYNTDEVSAAGVRRFLARVGPENIDDIMKVREADRIGSGVPKAVVYKMRHLLYMIEKVRRDPVSAKMLELNGNDLMKILEIPPGPRVGFILAILLEEVLDDPEKNSKENLHRRARELGKLTDRQLIEQSKRSKARKEEFEADIDKEIKQKHKV